MRAHALERWLPRWAWPMWAAVFACACTSSSAAAYDSCDATLQCAAGTRCVAAVLARDDAGRGLCTTACRQNTDCPLPPPGVAARVCVLLNGADAGECHAFCEHDFDCMPGTVCRPVVLATGENTQVCVP